MLYWLYIWVCKVLLDGVSSVLISYTSGKKLSFEKIDAWEKEAIKEVMSLSFYRTFLYLKTSRNFPFLFSNIWIYFTLSYPVCDFKNFVLLIIKALGTRRQAVLLPECVVILYYQGFLVISQLSKTLFHNACKLQKVG